MQTIETATQPPAADSELGLLDIMIVLAKHKKVVLGFPIAAAIVAGAVSFVMPNVYRANAKILPPQQAQSGAAALLAQLGGVASVAGGAAGIKNPNDLYIGMLRSRRVADGLIARMDLKKVYDTPNMDMTRKTLETNTSIMSAKDGLISIEVEDEDPKRAAQLTNAYAEELLKLTRTLAVTEAAQRRLFFERELNNAKNNLARSESLLKVALDTHGVVSVDAQSHGLVETVARVRAQIAVKEIEIDAMNAFITPNNPDYKRAAQELTSMRQQLSKLENGTPQDLAASDDKQSNTGLDNIKVLRDVKYFQMLYELLAKQYEVARLDESKDSAIIQVLDQAIEPEQRARPKRAIIVLISALFALFVAIFYALSIEAMRDARRHGAAAKLRTLRDTLRGQ